MPLIHIAGAGTIGVIRDLAPHEIAPEAWSDAGNVRFFDGKAVKFLGHIEVFDPPSIPPYFALGCPTADNYFWLYAGLTKAYAFDGSNHVDVTRASGDYAASISLPWTGSLLGGIPVINQPADNPQVWNPIAVGTPLVDLPNWPAATKCRVVKAFGPYLVAINVSKGSDDFIHMVKWSHPADPGTVPSSWDHTDPTKDAGENDLEDTHAGALLDELPLGPLNILYKQSSTWGMQFIGGINIFRFFKIAEESGILATRCASLLGDGRHHFVATGSDVVLHDGQRMQSVADRTWRRWLSNNIDTSTYNNSFTVMNLPKREAWFCFPEVGATWPTLAFTWNWGDGTTGIRELKDVAYITPGIVSETDPSDTWDGGPAIDWQADTVIWGDRTYNPQEQALLMLDPVNTKFYQADTSHQFNGTNMQSFVERRGLAIVGTDRSGNPKVDQGVRKLVTEIWPRVTGGPIDVRVGAQETPEAEINWQTPQSFDPKTQEKLDICVEGKYIGVRFESASDTPWELHGYQLNVEATGRY